MPKKSPRKPSLAPVISLAAYRVAPAPSAPEEPRDSYAVLLSMMDAYFIAMRTQVFAIITQRNRETV
jgi:hypothetical protein